ncbi:MAG TPA: CpsD/CapB family tyrosine-protein kinase [Gammaproteobacteria bacterium]|nr:CpsD/CapB family tyrosine-protein kinase [Gammaproteobacteria bacterium]
MSNLEKGLKRARAALHSIGPGAADLAPILDTGNVAVAPAPAPALGPTGEPAFDIERLEWVQPDVDLLEQNRIVIDERSSASAAYKVLRTRVLQRMRRNGWKTLAVTGTSPNEGKTLTAINLSINLAWHLTTSVVLVDMDLRNPSVHRYLGIDTRYGVMDYLNGDVPLVRAGVRPGIERLGVIMNDRPVANASELLSSPEAVQLIEEVKRGDDRIAIFDMPPVFAGDDVLAFAPLVDAVLIVLAQGTTNRASLVALKELLQNVNVIGSVLNRSSERVAPYYYGRY